MKKTYIIPEVQVVMMHATSMLATSDPKVINTTLNANEAESKSSGNWNLWDDDDKE